MPLNLLVFKFPVNMGDSSMDASATVSETVAEEVSFLSMTDMILFSLIVGLMTYWFLFRKKKDEIPEFTKIQPMTSSVKDSSFVEKMKKTVSFLCVCARPQGVEALVDGGGRPAPLGERQEDRHGPSHLSKARKLSCVARKASAVFWMFTS